MFPFKFGNCTWTNQWKRSFTSQQVLRDAKPDQVSRVPPPDVAAASENPVNRINKFMYRPTNFDKKILVWVKKFKSIEEVPDQITVETLQQARSKARVRFSIWMMIGSALGCIGAVAYGKYRAKQGDSVHKMNVQWHERINEEYRASQEKLKNKTE